MRKRLHAAGFFAMREIACRARRRRSFLAAVVVALGLVPEVDAANPRPSAESPTPRSIAPAASGRIRQTGFFFQRRGRTMLPSRPSPVDSSPMIDDLNKALRALAATDRDYDGHRDKAIAHIEAAIHRLAIPGAQGTSNAAAAKPNSGKPPAQSATPPQDASDASLRKARTVLFAVHHKLTDKASTLGRIRADAEVRIAIDELTHALKPTPPPTGTPAK